MNKFLFFIALIMPLACSGSFKNYSVKDFEKAISNDKVQIVDVRTPAEFADRRIPRSINIDIYNTAFMDSVLVKLDKEKPVALYCRSGKRSASAASMLTDAGFKDVINLQGGIFSWMAEKKMVCDANDYIVFDGETAPDIEFEIFNASENYPADYKGGNGARKKLSSMRGKVIMLQFTASWCGVCRKEMPDIEAQIYKKHNDSPDFVLIGIDRDEDAATLQKFIKATGISYPIAFDPEGDVFNRFAVPGSGITRNVLIDKRGKIVMRTRLYKSEEFSALASKIEALLKE